MNILMDYRETKNRLLIAALQEHPGVKLKTGNLKPGDYLIDNHLLIERKTFHDFAQSIKDGRLFKQAAQLAAAKKYAALILEGTSSDLKNTGIKREALQGALISLTLKFNLPVLRSATQKETAWLMMAAAGQCDVTRRPKKNPLPRPAPAKRKNTAQKQLFILQGLPGIGPGRAKNLLEKFGSLNAVFYADVEELRITDGIGSKTAEKLWEVMNWKG